MSERKQLFFQDCFPKAYSCTDFGIERSVFWQDSRWGQIARNRQLSEIGPWSQTLTYASFVWLKFLPFLNLATSCLWFSDWLLHGRAVIGSYLGYFMEELWFVLTFPTLWKSCDWFSPWLLHGRAGPHCFLFLSWFLPTWDEGPSSAIDLVSKIFKSCWVCCFLFAISQDMLSH